MEYSSDYLQFDQQLHNYIKHNNYEQHNCAIVGQIVNNKECTVLVSK